MKTQTMLDLSEVITPFHDLDMITFRMVIDFLAGQGVQLCNQYLQQTLA